MSSAGEGETFMSQISLQADETYMDERLDKFLSAMLPDQSHVLIFRRSLRWVMYW